MNTRHPVIISTLAIMTIAAGCTTAPKQPDPFVVNATESEAMAEGALRSSLRRAERLKRIDPRFAIHVPYFHLTNATLDTALSELNAAWIKELGAKELPVVIKIDYSPAGDPPYEGYPGLRENISLMAHDLTVAELLVIIADVSPYRLEIMGKTPTLECRHWIEEDWVTCVVPVSAAGKRFLGLTDSTSSTELSAQLNEFGILFPDKSGFYARWVPEIERLIIFNYQEQIDRLRAILTLVDEGYEIKKRSDPDRGCATESKNPHPMTIRDLHLADLSPVVALAQFHDEWSKAIAPSEPPPFLLACETNRITVEGSFRASSIGPADFLKAYCPLVCLRYTSYTNGIVLFPVPAYDAGIDWQEIPIGSEVAASLNLGDGSRQQVEEALKNFGLDFPRPGCKALYDKVRQSLIIEHVPIELKKAQFLVDQAAKGVKTDDVAIDPSLHVARVGYSYQGGGWTMISKHTQTSRASIQ